MRVNSVDNTMFLSSKTKTINNLMRLSRDKRFTDIEPIKNYTQYLKEYGLDTKTRKK